MEQIASITVTFNPDTNTIKDQLEGTSACALRVIIDNGSEDKLVLELRRLTTAYENVIFISLEENRGIAAAQNHGAARALEQNQDITHLLFLDHDTVPQPDSIASLGRLAVSLTKSQVQLAAVGPTLIHPRDKIEYGFQSSKLYYPYRTRCVKQHIEVDFLNSSGSLIPIETWRTVGQFDEHLFIDHVETEWCLRAKQLGFRLFGSGKSIMRHSMGEKNCEYWLFGRRSTPYRTPVRHYYIFRNSLLLQKRSYTPRSWKLLNFVKLLLTFCFFGIGLTTEHKNHRKMITRGLIDGIKGKSGPFNSD